MKEWIFSIDHKRIGILYLIGSIAAFLVAGLMAFMMRIELGAMGPTLTDNPQDYNVWLFAHGAIMVLGFQIPALTGFLGNWAVPIMVGAKDMAFPRLNSLSVWIYLSGVVLALLNFVIPDSAEVMWTGYPPYSVVTDSNTALYSWVVIIMGMSSIVGAVNIVTTIVCMRAKGMGYFQMNMTTWAVFGANILQLIFIPVLASAVTLLLFDKYLGANFFNPENGGDVLIYQNLFWFYSHPAVYVILLPFVGMCFDIIATFARNMIWNYKFTVIFGMIGVPVMSGDVWIHHAYAAGMPDWVRLFMMVTTLLISVPVGVLMIALVGTLYKSSIKYTTPMLYSVGMIFMFLIGGLTGIPNAMVSIDLSIVDSYYIMAHFHYVMAISGTMIIFASVYYYFPKMTGKMYNEGLGKLGFVLFVGGMNVVMFPLLIAGYYGMPRRYYDWSQMPEMAGYQELATTGVYIAAAGALVVIISWVHGLIAGKPADSANPWNSLSLEFVCTDLIPGPGNFTKPGEYQGGVTLTDEGHYADGNPKCSVIVEEGWTPYNYAKLS